MKRSVLIALAAAVVVVLPLGLVSAAPEDATLFPTTTTLTPAISTVTYGQESTVIFSATVTGGLTPPNTGTVTVATGSITLCTFDLNSANSGSCSPTSDTLLSASGSPYAVTATFGGNTFYDPSDPSSAVSLTVDPQTSATSLGFSPTSLVYGQESTLTFNSSVTPQISGAGTPTGSIAVAAGSVPLCTIMLPATSCATTDDPLSAIGGPYAITATYSGDANYVGSTSSPEDLAITPASTATTLSLSSSSVFVGDESTLVVTATVAPESGGSPSGTISVTAGGSPVCDILLPATTCSPLDNSLSPLGSPYTLSASYPGDANFIGSTSNTESLTVTPGNTTTTLSIAPSTVVYGTESGVTFTADVSSLQSGTPTGTVTVSTGTTTLCAFDVTQASSCTTSDTELGVAGSPYSVIASYSGDGTFNPSSSDPGSLFVQPAATTTTLTGPFSVVYGNEGIVTFTPTVSALVNGTPTGTVTVATGTTTLCTFTLPSGTGCAAPNTRLPSSGSPYPVTASYAGDANFTGSISTPPQNLTVSQAGTATTLSLSSSTVTYGNEASLSFTATVAPQFVGAPSGTINVMAGSTPLCSITLPSSKCSTTDDPLNASGTSYAITAVYVGDTNFTGSTSNTKSLAVAQATTSTSLSLSPSSVGFGSESGVVFTATVVPQFPASPTGTITVATGTTTLCTITLPTPNPTCSTNDDPLAPSVSPYPVTASYVGDTNFMGSNSTARNLTVTAATTTTTLSLSTGSVVYGNEASVTFTATVTPAGSGGSPPTGVITVATGTTTLCTIAVTAATTCITGATALGASGAAYPVVATYGGDANYGGSTSSPARDLTVTQASTGTALQLSSTTVTYGNEQTVTFATTVTPQFAGSTPTGTVTVTSGATTLCTFTLPTASPSCSATSTLLAASGTPYALAATYGGDANFTGSDDTSQSLTVNQAGATAALTVTPTSVAFGSESTVALKVTVSAQYGGQPSGVVTVATPSTTLCTITLPATTCSTTDQALAPSGTAYTITATYPGDTNFTSSASNSGSLMITGGSSTTALALSSPSVAYGNETTVVFTVTVTPLKTGTPTGTATVEEGTTKLCTATLSGSAGTCSPAAGTKLTASSTAYTVVATYSGDSDFTPSGSDPQALTVTQATTGTALSVSPSSVTYGGESAATFSTTLTPEFSGTPTGSVTISAGSTTLCTVTLTSGTGTCTTGPTSLGAGGYAITASYHGDKNFQSSSGPGNLTVNQATPSAPSINNVPAGAAEEGSFVANIVTSGDGARLVVSQTQGTCTVGSDGVTVNFLIAGTCTLAPLVSSGHNYTGANGSPQTFTIGFGPRGYWLVGSDGGIFSFGTAQFYGSMGGTPLQRPVVGITPTHTKHGYWLVASDGGIFSFGDSNFYGSIPGLGLHPAGSGQPNSLDAPIVGMVPSSDGNGYFMVASDGGVFAFGDAKFAGSCPGIGGCAGSAVAVMPDHSGNGYWLVTSAGAIYAFGDAPFFGSPSPQSAPVVNAVATPDGHGYWILYANGTVLNFGDGSPLGDPLGYVNGFNPATSIFPTTDGLGYWVASARGDVFSYGNAPFLGSMSSTPLNGPIIAAFGF